jgi:hypothetical protein
MIAGKVKDLSISVSPPGYLREGVITPGEAGG